jgi:1,2-phenylacetyl-CoA epoxidase catalytic subunit
VAAPENEWVDVVLNCMFLDRAGRLMVGNFAESSFAPWATACKAILRDEDMHVGFGLTGFRRFLKEEKDRDKLSRHVTRWYAYGLNFFGPPASSKDQALFDYGLKRKSNEALRREYIAEVADVLAEPGRDLLRLSTDAYPYH